jgi:hypothetical protein
MKHTRNRTIMNTGERGGFDSFGVAARRRVALKEV